MTFPLTSALSPIACVGGITADVVGKTVDSLPARGTLERIERIELHIGGNAANTSAALGKLGVGARLIGKVGDDSFGDFLLGALQRSGVGTAGVARAGGNIPSGASLVTVHTGGERSFLHAPGANADFGPEDIDWAALDGCAILHVAGPQLLPRLEGEPLAGVLTEAKRRGMTTALDTVMNPLSLGWRGLTPALPLLDWFLPSFEEIRALTGENTVEGQLDACRRAGAGSVAIKLGADGCFVAPLGEAPFPAPARPVEVVDTLGAGDCWCAGFLIGLLHGWEIENTARFAGAVAARCVGALGATTGIVDLARTLETL